MIPHQPGSQPTGQVPEPTVLPDEVHQVRLAGGVFADAVKSVRDGLRPEPVFGPARADWDVVGKVIGRPRYRPGMPD